MLRLAGRTHFQGLKHIVSAVKADLGRVCSASNEHETDQAFCRRGIASHDAPSEPPVLKKVLRELYKRVHPDLFHDVPHAREANEHSFKLLQVTYMAPACRLGNFRLPLLHLLRHRGCCCSTYSHREGLCRLPSLPGRKWL